MYAQVVASKGIKVVTHKFLEHGHTQNEGDSMYVIVKAQIGRTSVYSPQQYYIIVLHFLAKKTGMPYVVTELDFKTCVNGENFPVKNW